MKLIRRSVLAVSSLILVPLLWSSQAGAQGKSLELRVDFISLETSDGNTDITLEFPGSFAMAFYFSPQFALEPGVLVHHLRSDGGSVTFFGASLFAPFYFQADGGKSGLFISPGVSLLKATGDFESDALFDYGVDLGFKRAASNRVSTRFALTLRDGDSHDKVVLGAAFGVGFFWR